MSDINGRDEAEIGGATKIYLMNRRAFTGMMVAGAASALLDGVALAQPAPKARNVVFVHGLLADGACWSEIIVSLQPKGIQVTAVQNPRTTLQEAVEITLHALAPQQGPTVLVAHSFASMIVTEAGVDPKVSAFVYVAARAPDAGKDYTAPRGFQRCQPRLSVLDWPLLAQCGRSHNAGYGTPGGT